MTLLAMGFGAWIVLAAAAVVAWLFGHRTTEAASPDPEDPDAPDEDGFIPADKYGYGYGYSWGDPYGDPDL